jgi:dTMP kinase
MAFIVLEGLDGSGKSTLISRLEKTLQQKGKTLRVTREPGGTPLAEKLRNLVLDKEGEAPHPRTEVLIYEASRAQHVEMVIRPHLSRGDWVLCDRFFGSTVAFQVFGRGLDREQIDWLNKYATDGLQPDLTIYLDLSVEVSLSRMQGRSKDRMESEEASFHERVRQGYLAQAKENPESWIVLSSEMSPQDLEKEVLKAFKERGWLD